MDFPADNTSLKIIPLWMAGAGPRSETAEDTELTALLQRAISGDSAAFEQLLIRNERAVLSLAFRMLGSLEDAQDAAQEVFLRAFKYLHRFDSRKPIRPWLMQMTVNVCRDHGRQRLRRRVLFSESDAAPVETIQHAAAGTPHTEFASEQQKRTLHRILAELPEKERTAIILRDIEGFSTAEAAAILESSEATIRSQISSARVKIKKAIERLKGDPR